MPRVPGQRPESTPCPPPTRPDRPTPRLSRTLAGIVAIILVAAAALVPLGFAPWTLSSEALTEEIASQIYGSSGLYVAIKGRPRFAFLPRPHILAEGLALADPKAFVTLEAERLHGDVRLAALLTGRLEIERLTLYRPFIKLDLQKAPSLAYAPATVASPARNVSARKGWFGKISLVDGRITLSGDKPQAIENLNATLEWPRLSSPATLTGEADWRDERLRGLLWIARPDVLRQGDQTPLTLRLESAAFHIEAEGMAQAGVMPRYAALIRASAPSLRQALAILDISPALPGPMENCEMTAQASIGLTDITLSQLRLLADGNDFEGFLAISQDDGRPRLQGDLSARHLSLKPFLDYLPTVSGADGQWSRDNFELPNLAGADLDFRLRAAHAHLSRLSLEDAELNVNLRGGRLELDLKNARVYKGKLKGRATFAMGGQNGFESHAEADGEGIDAGALLWDAVAHEDISGSLDATITLNAAGDSMAAMMRDLDGLAGLSLTKGSISGLDLTRAMSRLEKRPLASALSIRSGRSRIEKASAAVKISEGVASVEDGSASGPGFSLAFSGSTRVLDKSLALRAQVFATDESGAPRSKGQQINFELAGPWDDLSFVTDAKALIRRSGAAAPLLPPPAAAPSEAENTPKQRPNAISSSPPSP